MKIDSGPIQVKDANFVKPTETMMVEGVEDPNPKGRRSKDG